MSQGREGSQGTLIPAKQRGEEGAGSGPNLAQFVRLNAADVGPARQREPTVAPQDQQWNVGPAAVELRPQLSEQVLPVAQGKAVEHHRSGTLPFAACLQPSNRRRQMHAREAKRLPQVVRHGARGGQDKLGTAIRCGIARDGLPLPGDSCDAAGAGHGQNIDKARACLDQHDIGVAQRDHRVKQPEEVGAFLCLQGMRLR